MDQIKEINIKFTTNDISLRKPKWEQEKCEKFLKYVQEQVILACEAAGNDVIDFVMGIKQE